MDNNTLLLNQEQQAYLATVAITSSVLRNQGAPGVIQAAQGFLSTLDLSRFTATNEADYLAILDTVTVELQHRLPIGAQRWGAARKALNLFLRDACYHRFLAPQYALEGLEPYMEIPLDSVVAEALMAHAKAKGRTLPTWQSIKELTAEVSRAFQAEARSWANATGVTLPHLDMRIWTTERLTT